MLEQFLVSLSFGFLLIFCRIGGAIMLMPGFGEAYVSARFRLVLALVISIMLLPVLSPLIPVQPSSTLSLAILVISEIFIGIFIGSVCNILVTLTHTSGMIFSYQSGLASAVIFDPTQSSQGSVVGNFIGVLFVVLIFSLNLHHLMLRGIIESYTTFAPGHYLPLQDAVATMVHVVSETFLLAVKITAPFIIVGMLLFLGGGVLSRLMPTIQIFFLITPVQLLLGFLVFMVAFSAMMLASVDFYHTMLISLFGHI